MKVVAKKVSVSCDIFWTFLCPIKYVKPSLFRVNFVAKLNRWFGKLYKTHLIRRGWSKIKPKMLLKSKSYFRPFFVEFDAFQFSNFSDAFGMAVKKGTWNLFIFFCVENGFPYELPTDIQYTIFLLGSIKKVWFF